MLTTVTGTYKNGQVILDEIPNINEQAKVFVTFLAENENALPQKRRLGSLKGKIGLPDDFNEPLEDLNDYMH